MYTSLDEEDDVILSGIVPLRISSVRFYADAMYEMDPSVVCLSQAGVPYKWLCYGRGTARRACQ